MVDKTASEVLADGRGVLEFRLQIEGIPVSWVTSQRLAGTYSGFTRVNGLDSQQLRILARAGLMDRRLESGRMTFEVVEQPYGDPVLGGLSFTPTWQSDLTETITESSTILKVRSVSGVTAGDVVHIGREAILVGSVDAPSNELRGCTRGYYQSVATAHLVQTSRGTFQPVKVSSHPVSLERRRCRLYAYGDGDSPSSTGTLLWRGILTSDLETSQDLCAFRFGAHGITELLGEKIGGSFGEAKIKGIYHPTSYGFALRVMLGADEKTWDSGFTATDEFQVLVEGYHENAAAFVAEVSAQLQAGSASWPTKVWADIEEETKRMRVRFYTDGTNKAIAVRQIGGLRASGIPDPVGGWGFPPENFNTTLTQVLHVDPPTGGDMHVTLAGFQHVITPVGESAAYPDNVQGVYLVAGNSPRSSTVYGAGRLFFDSSGLDTSVNALRLVPPEEGTPGVLTGHPSEIWVSDVEVISADAAVKFTSPQPWMLIDDSWEIQLGLNLAQEGSVVDAITTLTELAVSNPDLAPNITTEDVDLDSFHTAISGTSLSPIISKRNYSIFAPVSLDEYLAEEMKLAGLMPTIEPSNGKIGARRIRFASINEPDTVSVTEAELIGEVTVKRGKDHYRTVARLNTGWDFIEEEHTGRNWEARFSDAIANFGSHTYTISPKSREVDSVLSALEVEEVLIRPISLFGAPYQVIDWRMGLTTGGMSLSPGSVISLTDARLPNFTTAQRGVDGLVGYVLGVERTFGRTFGVHVEALVSEVSLAGYTPTMKIASATYISGNAYDVNVLEADNGYSPSGYFDYEFWAVGDGVRVEELDSWTPETAEGYIENASSAAGTHTFRVVFGASVPSGLAADMSGARVTYQAYSGSNMTADQKGWLFMGDEAGGSTPPDRYFGA